MANQWVKGADGRLYPPAKAESRGRGCATLIAIVILFLLAVVAMSVLIPYNSGEQVILDPTGCNGQECVLVIDVGGA